MNEAVTRVPKSEEALTALAYSVLRRVPSLERLRGVTIARVNSSSNGPNWKVGTVEIEGGANLRQLELAAEALLPWTRRYDLT